MAARLAEKAAFLRESSAYPRMARSVSVCETHTAMVFLTEDRAYKLKKPIRLAYLDFTTLTAREQACREEVRINQATAPGIYIGVVALRQTREGVLTLAGDGIVVDWLIEMVRLPESEMLDRRLSNGGVKRAEIDRLGEHLCAFYLATDREPHTAKAYLDHLVTEADVNLRHLARMQHHIGPLVDGARLAAICSDRIKAAMPEIRSRIDIGLVLDGHGDLRPEHVCLIEPPVVFDRLEFDPAMRMIDVYDEINFLGLECARLGCDWIGPALLDRIANTIGAPPSAELFKTYGMFRMLLRARLSIDHLNDKAPRYPEKWPVQARAYLLAAADILAQNGPPATPGPSTAPSPPS